MVESFSGIMGFILSLCTLGGILIAAGKLVARLEAHEKLDEERHGATTGMFKEIRADIKELLQR